MRTWMLALALLSAPLSEAQAPASMSPDEAFVRAVTYIQNELAKRDAEHKLDKILADSQAFQTRKALDDALAALDQLRTEAKHNDPAARAALSAFAQGNGQKGVSQLLDAAKAAETASATQANDAVEKYKRAGSVAEAVNPVQAIDAYQNALRLAPRDTDALLNLANLQVRMANLDNAESTYSKLLELTPANQVDALDGLAHISMLRGDFAGARNYLETALGVMPNSRSTKRAATESNLGVVFANQGDFSAAKRHFERSAELAGDLGDKSLEASTLTSLGNIAKYDNDLSTAHSLHNRALALYKAIGDKAGMAAALGNLGSLAFSKSAFLEAKVYQEKSLAISVEIGHVEYQAYALNHLGMIAAAQNKNLEACAYFRQSEQLTRSSLADSTVGKAVQTNIDTYCSR